MLLRSVIGLLFCLLLSRTCLAQGTDTTSSLIGYGFSINPIAGKVFKHEAKFTLPIPALTTGLDVLVTLNTYGKKEWQQRRHYPVIGLSLIYVNYGIDAVYGRLFSLCPQIIVPLASSTHFVWTLRIGDGIDYITREYHRTAPVDTTNVAIGNKINNFIAFGSFLQYHINCHWDVQLSGSLLHTSNGSYKKPNLGINMLGASAGVTYYPATSRPDRIQRTLPSLKNRWLAQVRLSTAMVSSYTSGGPVYPVYIASGYASRRWRNINKLFLGLDYAYNSDINAFLRNNGLEAGSEATHSYKSAFFAGNEFLFGRLGLVAQAGVYLHQAYIKKDDVYEKAGGHYYLVQKENGAIKELFLSALVKTHLNVAELIEFGIGAGF